MSGRRPARRAGTRAALAAWLALLLLLGAVACTSDDDDGDAADTTAAAGPPAGVLRMGVVGPVQLDPAEVLVGQADLIGVDLLYDTLPDLAEARADDERRVWTFELGDATFSDGSPVTADDVKASLERIARPGEQSLRGARLDVIDGYEPFVAGEAPGMSGIRAVDDDTVEITTAEPYGELERLLVDPGFGILPAGVDDDEGFFEQPVGSGPFALVESSDEALTFEAVEGRDVQLRAVEVRLFDSIDDSYAAFEAGEVDWSAVPADQLDEAVAEHGDEQFVPQAVELWFGFNLRNEKFQNQLFREAIIHSIDRPAIVADFYPGGLLMDGVVPRGVPGAQDNACGDRCVYVPDLSRQLLADAFPGGNVPTVMIDYDEDDFDREAAERISADLEAVGIPNELRPHSHEDYREFVVSGEQELFFFGWFGVGETPDTYLAPLFLSNSPDNVTGYHLELTDAAIAAARGFADEDERLAGYQEVERAVVGQVPVIPLVQLQSRVVVSDRVQGLATETDGTFDPTAVTVR